MHIYFYLFLLSEVLGMFFKRKAVIILGLELLGVVALVVYQLTKGSKKWIS
jgi:hypothetical protein